MMAKLPVDLNPAVTILFYGPRSASLNTPATFCGSDALISVISEFRITCLTLGI